MVDLLLIFWETTILFPIAAIPTYCTFPPTVHQGSLLSTSFSKAFLSLVFLIIALLTGVRRYLTVALICICLISNVEHLLMYLLAMCMSLEKCLFSSFTYFLNWIFPSLLSCMSSLYVLDINPLSDIWFANICTLLHSLSIPLWCYYLVIKTKDSELQKHVLIRHIIYISADFFNEKDVYIRRRCMTSCLTSPLGSPKVASDLRSPNITLDSDSSLQLGPAKASPPFRRECWLHTVTKACELSLTLPPPLKS